MLFIEYPKCSTCKKAKAHLDSCKIAYTDRHIVENNPSEKELKKWIKDSNINIKKMFNTSGILYREMGLSKKLDSMSDDEKIKILSSNGMLVKRPLIIKDDGTLIIGYKKEEYDKLK